MKFLSFKGSKIPDFKDCLTLHDPLPLKYEKK